MALNFQLRDIETQEAVSMSKIDERICKEVLNTEPHERLYGGSVFNWFDTIGFRLASGDTYEEVKEYYNREMWAEEKPIIDKIVDFLALNYTSHSWTSIGR